MAGGQEVPRTERGSVATATRRRATAFNPLSYIFTRQDISFYIFVAPWLIGFLAFTLGPFLASIWLSLTDWSLMEAAKFVGLRNFHEMFLEDETWRQAVWNTFYYTIVSVPLKQVIALSVAILLNQKLRGIYVYRTIFYLPAVTSGVATAMLWMQVFGYHLGALNALLIKVGIEPQAWLTDLKLAMPTLIFISLWNVGGIFLIYLAGLQGVSTHLYEAAEVDGAGMWAKFRNVTIPMITPSIFFNIVMGFIGSFQVFTAAYIITGGGPADRTLFYVLQLYLKAFIYFEMGYASAMAWVLFVIIMIFTLFQLWLSRRWVYYEGAPVGARI